MWRWPFSCAEPMNSCRATAVMNEDRIIPFKELAHDLGTRFSRYLPGFGAVSKSAASLRFTTSGLHASINCSVWFSHQVRVSRLFKCSVSTENRWSVSLLT